MTKQSAHDIATGPRQIRQDKILTIDANGKRMLPERLERMRRHIGTLDQAIEGFDNLARAQSERQAQQQEERAS